MIAIGCDHGGFEIKECIKKHLKEKGVDFKDFGTDSLKSVDYPLFAKAVAKDVAGHGSDIGILVCGTGIGVSIAANKFKGIRAALCHNTHYAKMARMHNDANILCLGGREINDKEAIDIVDAFLETNFEGGRHKKRLEEISKIEE